MPRPPAQHTEPVNGDSFLDIVASVVSIMIIMVVMVGMRIKNTPVKVTVPASPVSKELEKDLAAEQSLRADVWKMAEEVRNLERQAAAQGAQRAVLGTVVAAAEQEIQSRRAKLDQGKQADFDVARGLSEARFQLDQLVRQRQQVEQTPTQPIVVESYPTPLSRVVDGPEAHLLVSNGRVVFVPIEALVHEVKARLRQQGSQLANDEELTDTAGPIEGFRLRYTLERREISAEMMKETGRGGSLIQVKKFELLPIDNDLGEPVRLALKDGSDFRQALSKLLPGRVTITIWVYPDGFDAFRQIRRELYRLNYAIAARPLPAGQPISGSPEGSKSAAQ